MEAFKVKGGKKLSGTIKPQGAKNEALQVISAVLLTEEKVIIDNIPNIIDVNRLIDLLKCMGVSIDKINEHKYSFEASSINLDYLNTKDFEEKAKGLRGSIMIIGPLLSRFGHASIPKPGGDKIGRRKLDTHFEGLVKLGAKFQYDKDNYRYNVNGKSLKGTYILLDQPSVTGTANIVMTASLTDGETTLYNAASVSYTHLTLPTICSV